MPSPLASRLSPLVVGLLGDSQEIDGTQHKRSVVAFADDAATSQCQLIDPPDASTLFVRCSGVRNRREPREDQNCIWRVGPMRLEWKA